MNAANAHAKLNLALVVGDRRPNGNHELVTVMQRIGLADRIELVEDEGLVVEGFRDDTIVRAALEAIAEVAGVAPRWRARIDKSIPVAAGLGGGSSDAATALVLANSTLASPMPFDELDRIAARLGADVPFFLRDGPQLATGDGTTLHPLELPQDYAIVLVAPHGVEKASTGSVYAAFDARDGGVGFDARRSSLLTALDEAAKPLDLERLPANDLASSPLSDRLRELGAFRADVTGAGPVVYGLFESAADARAAAAEMRAHGTGWVTAPC